MQHNFHLLKGRTGRRGMRIAKACCLTALLNALPAAYAQQNNPPTAIYSQEVLAVPTFPTEYKPEENVLRYGIWDVLPRMWMGVTYDDNIFIHETGKQDDVIWTFAPGITLGAGDYRVQEGSSVLVDYTPSFNVFTDHEDSNSIDHDARLKAAWRPGRYSVSLVQYYQNLSGPVIDVGNRVDRVIYTTGLSFTYEISPKTSVELTGSQALTDYKDVSKYNEWNLGAFFDYALTPKIKVGVGVNAGWVDIQNQGNQKYQQGLVRAVYAATEKVDIRGSAGFEVRQFQSGQDNHLNGVWSVGGTYKPAEFTQILLDAYRRDQNSVILVDQNYTTTGFGLGVRREFLTKYAATLTGGYDHLDYHSASPTVSSSRVDDFFFVQLKFDYQVLDRLTAGAFYMYRKNDSNEPYSFDNHQVGLNIAYRF